MKARETKGPPSTDLLVCFPSRAHLKLLPKPICSPARPVEPSKRHHNHRHKHHHPHHCLKKSNTRGGGCGQVSPLLWNKNKQMDSEISEPTSPKVTCAGQIKVKHKGTPCKNWQSVMEEIERIHSNRKNKKRSSWMDSFGFKKDVMQFLTCLRTIRFDFRCFGSIPQSDITSDDDEEVEEDEEFQENQNGGAKETEASRTIFSKWFMVLQENQNNEFCKEKRKEKEKEKSCFDESIATSSVPPPNALLLMRCRSAPAKSWLKEKVEEEEEDNEEGDEQEQEQKEDRKIEEKKGKNLQALIEEEKRNTKAERLVVMRYDTDFYKISSDIAKETWVVGGMGDPLSRSRSWKR